MARVIRYPGRAQAYDAGDTSGGPDGYLSKLAKYVPGEFLAIAGAFYAAFNPTGATVWIALIVLAVINMFYLWFLSLKTEDAPRLPWYTYVFALVSVFVWALAFIEPVSAALGWDGSEDAAKRNFVLMFAAFLIPAADEAIALLNKKKLREQREAEQANAEQANAAAKAAEDQAAAQAAQGKQGEL